MAEEAVELQKPTVAINADEQETIDYVSKCISDGVAYRDLFSPTWVEIESQLRCVKPAAWDKKENWQTKCYIPMQAKTSEIVYAYLNKMLFNMRRNYNISTLRSDLRPLLTPLMDLIDNILDLEYEAARNNILQEAVDIGTSFLLLSMDKEKGGVCYSWVSPYNCIVDPLAREDFYKSRYWAREYKKDIGLIIQEFRNGTSIYSQEAINKLISTLQKSAIGLKDEDITTIRNIDGSGDIKISNDCLRVTIWEFYGKKRVKQVKKVKDQNGMEYDEEYYTYEDKILNIANGQTILREDDNIFGFIPVFIMRTKKRKFDMYGKGYFENTMDLQDLGNSMINLGFDSLKIAGMDIVIVDETKIADETSIVYRPLAIWKMKDVNAVNIRRTGLSALGEILRGLATIDAIHQDSTGSTRHVQGSAPALGTPTSGEETLGEFELKTQMADNRFLNIGKDIEITFQFPLIMGIMKIIMNPALFTQDMVNKMIGMKTETTPEEIGGMVTERQQEVPKLDLEELRKIGLSDMELSIIGVTRFINKAETMQKLEKLLGLALSNQQAGMKINIDALLDRILELSEITDYKDLVMNRGMDPASLMTRLREGMGLAQPGQNPVAGGAV